MLRSRQWRMKAWELIVLTVAAWCAIPGLLALEEFSVYFQIPKVSKNAPKPVCVGGNMSKFLVVQDTMNVSVTTLPGDKNSTRHICHTVTCDGSYWPRCLQRSLDWGGRSVFFLFRECFVRFLRYVPGTAVKGCLTLKSEVDGNQPWSLLGCWRLGCPRVHILTVASAIHQWRNLIISTHRVLGKFGNRGRLRFRDLWLVQLLASHFTRNLHLFFRSPSPFLPKEHFVVFQFLIQHVSFSSPSGLAA